MSKTITTVGYSDVLSGISIPLASIDKVYALKSTVTIITTCGVEIPMRFNDVKEANSALKSIKNKLIGVSINNNYRVG